MLAKKPRTSELHTVVVGLGRSGISAAKLLKTEGHSVVVLESSNTAKQQEVAAELGQQGIDVQLGRPLALSSFEPWLAALEAVVVSPGIAWDHPTLEELRRRGVTIQQEIAVAWRALRHLPWIGITGTNGKTTTAYMMTHVFESSGLQAPMGGNMGFAATELALNQRQAERPADWLVIELSSYMLEAAPEIAPRIGIWTTLTPDHLERHKSLENYRAIKRSLLEHSEVRIFNADDPDLQSRRGSWDHGLWVSTAGPGSSDEPNDFWIDAEGWVCEKQGRLFSASALQLPGAHNQQNMLFVTAAARQAGLLAEGIEKGLRSFPGVPHRIERLGAHGGATIFNDSKATNYDAAEVGLKAVAGPAVVLAGGQSKQGDASAWLEQLRKKSCAVVLFGEAAAEFRALIKASAFEGEVRSCDDLSQALNSGVELAEKHGAASLLLSPACASFDQYASFEARGDHFRELVKAYLAPK